MSFDRKKKCRSFLISATVVLSAFFCSKKLAADPGRKPVADDSGEISAEAVQSEETGKNDPSGLLFLQKLTVTVSVYKLPRTKLEIWKLNMFFALKSDFGWPPLGGNGGAFVLAPGRVPQRIRNVASTVVLVDSDEFRSSPFLLGDVLSFVPDFTFSRNVNGTLSDRNAALRGISALVLLDGVPINNPFDSSVGWAGIPQEGLARTEIVSGGGASAWGNGALGGVIQFLTLPAKGKMTVETGPPPDGGPPDPTLTKQVVHATGRLAASIGSFNTQSTGFVTSQPTRSGVLQVLGGIFRSAGYSLIASEQSGPIDRTAWSRNKWLEARWRQPIGKSTELVATIRDHDQSFGSGTPGQHGTSHEILISAAVAGSSKVGLAWNALAYIQHGSSTQTFSAINMDRASEIPVIDQFARPVAALGANWSAAWRHRGDSRTNFGVDLRSLSGEIRENVDDMQNVFTHQLIAGGKQAFAGAFLLHEQVINSQLRANLGVRIDRWNETNGHQREIERSTQDVIFDHHFSADRGKELSPSLGIVWQAAKSWRWRIDGQQAFRRPALSERYSFSGVNSVLIFGNPNLRTEHNDSIEIATDYSFHRKSSPGPQNKSAVLIFGVKAFSNELHDAAGTVTIPRGTGEFLPLDALHAGYRGEQQTNLDRVKIQGFALSSTWNPAENISLEAKLLVTDATIRHVPAAPALHGKQMPNVPHHTVSLGAKGKIGPALQLRAQARLTGSRFADSENTLILDSAVTADFGATYAFNERTEFQFMAENIANRRFQTDVSTAGIFYLDAPRILSGRVRFSW